MGHSRGGERGGEGESILPFLSLSLAEGGEERILAPLSSSSFLPLPCPYSANEAERKEGFALFDPPPSLPRLLFAKERWVGGKWTLPFRDSPSMEDGGAASGCFRLLSLPLTLSLRTFRKEKVLGRFALALVRRKRRRRSPCTQRCG